MNLIIRILLGPQLGAALERYAHRHGIKVRTALRELVREWLEGPA